MSIAHNKAIVTRFYDELLNQENKAVIDDIFAADAMIHDPFIGTQRGSDAFRGLLAMFDTGFPGHRVTVENVIAEGDFVVVLHTHTAVHTGPFMNLPPTGKNLVVNGVELFRLQNGKIVEFWRKDDDVSLLMQLGILPLPQAT